VPRCDPALPELRERVEQQWVIRLTRSYGDGHLVSIIDVKACYEGRSQRDGRELLPTFDACRPSRALC